MEIFESKIKPDLSTFSDDKLVKILIEKTGECNFSTRLELVNKIYEIWGEIPLSNDLDCPICLEKVTNNNHLITNCGHYFHSNCVFKYIIDKNNKKNIFLNKFEISCPQCRNVIYQDAHVEEDIENEIEDYNEYEYDSSDIGSNIQNNQLEDSLEQEFSHIEQDNNDNNNFEQFDIPINLHTGLWYNMDQNLYMSTILGNVIILGETNDSD
jgi:hypothetical protein